MFCGWAMILGDLLWEKGDIVGSCNEDHVTIISNFPDHEKYIHSARFRTSSCQIVILGCFRDLLECRREMEEAHLLGPYQIIDVRFVLFGEGEDYLI